MAICHTPILPISLRHILLGELRTLRGRKDTDHSGNNLTLDLPHPLLNPILSGPPYPPPHYPPPPCTPTLQTIPNDPRRIYALTPPLDSLSNPATDSHTPPLPRPPLLTPLPPPPCPPPPAVLPMGTPRRGARGAAAARDALGAEVPTELRRRTAAAAARIDANARILEDAREPVTPTPTPTPTPTLPYPMRPPLPF